VATVPLPQPSRSIIAGALLAATSLPACAAELFVSTTGNDSNADGSSSRPYRTIKRAISAGRAGDTITIRAPAGNSTYNECDVRLRQRMILRSPPGERAHIHCDPGVSNSVVVQIDPNASGSRVSNLELSGSQYYGVMLQTSWYQGGPASDTGATDVILEDLLIHHTGTDGIKLTPKSNRATIRRVEIHSTGDRYPGNADGIDNVNADGMVVEDSYIHDTATTGLYFKGGARDVVIQRNRIENTGNAGILAGFDTSPEFFDLSVNPQYYESIRGIVRNNVVRNTRHSGIGMYGAKDPVIANNTIINAANEYHAAIYFGVTLQDYAPEAGRPATVNPRVLNNLVLQDNNRCVEIRYANELGGLSALTGSPGTDWNGYRNGCTFRDGRAANSGWRTLAQWRSQQGTDANSKQAAYAVDATGHLPANSPAIDAGTVVAEVTDDIDGQPRFAPYDIGADEAAGTSGGQRLRRNGSHPLEPGMLPASRIGKPAGAVPGASRPTPLAPAGARSVTPAALPAGANGTVAPAAVAPSLRIRSPIATLWPRLRAWLERFDADRQRTRPD